MDSFEVKEIVGKFGFAMKQLSQIKEEKGFMLAHAQYYRVLTAAFNELSVKKLTQDRMPSILKMFSNLKEAAQGRNMERAKVKNNARPRNRAGVFSVVSNSL